MVCTIDLANSLATHVGVDLPKDAVLDSMNVMDALLGEPEAAGRDHLISRAIVPTISVSEWENGNYFATINRPEMWWSKRS